MTRSRSTIPPRVPQGDAEDITWGVDVSSLLAAGETVTLPVVELTDQSGATVTLVDAATVDGTVVRQRVRAGVIVGGRYRLAVRITPSGTTNVPEVVMEIDYDG